METNRYDVLAQHSEAAKNLAYWKEEEMRLRTLVIAEFSDTAVDAEGTENYELNAGYKLKLVKKLNYTLSDKDGSLKNILDEIVMQTGTNLYADELVRWKPELCTGFYKKMDVAIQALLSPVLTIKPATPTIEIIEPKGKK
jgi:hypothetical protein